MRINIARSVDDGGNTAEEDREGGRKERGRKNEYAKKNEKKVIKDNENKYTAFHDIVSWYC